MSRFYQIIGLFALLLGLTGLLQGQVTTGTILGTVKDSSGAVLPGVVVQIQNQDTGIGRTVTTDSRGYYIAPNLSLGQYQATASLSGFQNEVRRGITLNVGQNAVIDFTLQVGAVTESVEVTEQAPLVETTTASVSALVSGKQVQDLPLNARNLIELAPLQAGIAYAVGAGAGDARRGFTDKLTIVGTRYTASLFQLDGIDINGTGGTAGSASGILMGAETVREFNVITNGYSAEYGKHTGGVFNAVTKSGTNSLHGSAFEFLRNDKLDARNFFDVFEKPSYKRNQFGGSLGGPIVKDRSFFFGSYEGLRERIGGTQFFRVPSLDLRQGRWEDPPNSGRVTTFSVPASIKPWLLAYPLPNGQDFHDGSAQFITPQVLPTTEDFFTVRMDHKLSDKDSLFGRYTKDTAERWPTGALLIHPVNKTSSQYMAVGETRIFSPTVINQFVAGFSRSGSNGTQALWAGATPLPVNNFTGRAVKSGVFPNFLVSGLDGFGTSNLDALPQTTLLNMFQFKDDVFYTKGAHSLKFGFNAQRLQDRETGNETYAGIYGFGNISDFMQALPNSFQALLPSPLDGTRLYERQSLYGLYAQDDYRVSQRLTVNLGLRYEFVTTYHEKYGNQANVMDPFTPGPISGILIGAPSFLNPSLKNFAPRAGIAWDPTGKGKTSIRAGAGVFYDQIFAMGSLTNALQKGVPGDTVGTLSTRGQIRFPDAFFTQQDLMATGVKLEGLQYKMNQPTIYKWSVDVEREVAPNTSVDLGYSGTRGVHLLRVVNMNNPVALNVNGRLVIPTTALPYHPGSGRIRPRISDSESDYHALRATMTRRFSRGLQFTGAYTWSKSIDDGTKWSGSSDFANGPGAARYLNYKMDRGLSEFDIRKNFTANFTYALPGKELKGVAGKALGGWEMSGILSLRDGIPLTATLQNPSQFTDVGAYPDVDTTTKVQYDTRNPNAYLTTSGFKPPPTNAIGNAGRGTMIGPGSATVNVVLVKDTAFTERLHLQFRSEFFNMLNRANFGLPSTNFFTRTGAKQAGVGQIISAAPGRQIQFGMRLAF